jgi:CRP-like cAMP-binding protein
MRNAILRRLRAVELFAECKRADLAAIDRLGVTLDVDAGRTLCRYGDVRKEFFVLLAGLGEVSTPQGSLAALLPGAWFGETVFLRGGGRRATVMAAKPSTLLVFGPREFNTLLKTAPGVRARLEATAARVGDGQTPTVERWYQPLAPDVPAIARAAREPAQHS